MSLSTNGKWTLANAIISMGVAFLLALVGYMLHEIDTLQTFRDKGDRFTLDAALAMEQRLSDKFPPRWLTDMIAHEVESQSRTNEEVKLELQRIQLQIDRLEGHDPQSYTEDR